MLPFVWGITFGMVILTIMAASSVVNFKGKETGSGKETGDYPDSTKTVLGTAWTLTAISVVCSVVASVVYLIMWKTGSL